MLSGGDKPAFKLCDFGFAKKIYTSSTKGLNLDTEYFIPPELFSESKYTYSGDVWQVGVLLFYIVTFAYPFVGETEVEIQEKIASWNITPFSEHVS